MSGGNVSVSKEDVLKLIVAGRENGSALVDLGGIEKVENGKVLDSEDAIHAFKTQAALAIEEVGDVSLLESGLLSETESGQIAFINALPKSIAQILLQHAEFHGSEYSTLSIAMR